MDSPEDYLLYQLWKQEQKMKIDLKINDGFYSIEDEFIIRYITTWKIASNTGNITEQRVEKIELNEEKMKLNVFQLLTEVLDQYEVLYIELSKLRPKVQTLSSCLE